MNLFKQRSQPAFLIAIAIMLLSSVAPGRQAAAVPITPTLVNTIITGAGAHSSWPPTYSPDPSGITYWKNHDTLVVVDGEVEEMTIWAGANLFETTRSGVLQATSDLTKLNRINKEPVGIDIEVDENTGTFFISNDSDKVIYVVELTKDLVDTKKLKGKVLDQFSTSAYGSMDPEGLTIGGGRLYTVDAAGGRVYITGPGANGRYDGVPPEGDDTTHGSFPTLPLGVADAEGIEYDPTDQTLYLVDRKTDIVAQATTSGDLRRTIKLRDFVPGVFNPADITLAPSSIGPGRSLYIVERGVDNNDDPNENDGKIYEIQIESGSSTPAAPTVTSLNPTSGPSTGGTAVTITGTGFDPGATTVHFGTANATNINCTSTTSCTATSPAGSGTVDVTVTVGGQTSTTSDASKFTYTSTNPPPTNSAIKSMTFEGGLTGADGADKVTGAVTRTTTNPLKDSASAQIQTATSASAYLEESFTGVDNLYISMYFKVNALPSSNMRIVQVQNGSTNIGDLQLMTDGTLRMRNAGKVVASATLVKLATGTVYRIGLVQKRGTGANGGLEAYLATGDAAFGAPFATVTNGTWTTQASRVRFGATQSAITNIVMDNIMLDSAAMR